MKYGNNNASKCRCLNLVFANHILSKNCWQWMKLSFYYRLDFFICQEHYHPLPAALTACPLSP